MLISLMEMHISKYPQEILSTSFASRTIGVSNLIHSPNFRLLVLVSVQQSAFAQ